MEGRTTQTGTGTTTKRKSESKRVERGTRTRAKSKTKNLKHNQKPKQNQKRKSQKQKSKAVQGGGERDRGVKDTQDALKWFCVPGSVEPSFPCKTLGIAQNQTKLGANLGSKLSFYPIPFNSNVFNRA